MHQISIPLHSDDGSRCCRSTSNTTKYKMQIVVIALKIIIIYYIDMSVLRKNRQLVFSIRNYIRDTSEIFSISPLVKISLTSFLCFNFVFCLVFFLFSKHSYLCSKKKITRCFEDMKFIFSFPLEDKLHIFVPPCNIL